MIRVNWIELSRRILITIEGALTGESVKVAEKTCNDALSTNAPVIICLNDVSAVDVTGRDFLVRMVLKKARLRAVGIYSRYVMKRVIRKAGPTLRNNITVTS